MTGGGANSTITVTLDSGTSFARTFTFSRPTSAASATTGYNVAEVNVLTGEVVEKAGTRAADARGEPPTKSKPTP